MHIGIPREIKPLEGRIALVPEACRQLIANGHTITMEHNAGALSGYPDEVFTAAGVRVVADCAQVYGDAGLIVKVKEPQDSELVHLRQEHLLFCFLHLAAYPQLARKLQDIGLTAVGFETVEEEGGKLPALAPMSAIAGRIATQVGTHLLHQPQGGKGLLLGGVPAAERGHVVIIGAGTAGGNAATLAASIGAEVVVFDLNRDRLMAMRELGNNVTALYPYQEALEQEVAEADIVIGAVLKTGSRAPHVVTRDMIRAMQPGSVVIDISVDQGGCIETTRPTSYENPTYIEEGVVHFAVTNMPGAVPRTASQALSAALITYVTAMAEPGWKSCKPLSRGINIEAGQFIHPALQEMFA
jgi:alanine dehydrogenase